MLPNRFVSAPRPRSFPVFKCRRDLGRRPVKLIFPARRGELRRNSPCPSAPSVAASVTPGNWLFYATGGFAWSYNQLTLTRLASGTGDMPFFWRLGWAAGAGVGLQSCRAGPRAWNISSQITATAVSFSRMRGSGLIRIGRSRDCAPVSTISSATIPVPPALRRDAGSGYVNFHGQTTLSGRAIRRFARPIRAPTACPRGEAARPWTRRSMPASGPGRAPKYGSIRKSTRDSG